jgi:hypothetical protein
LFDEPAVANDDFGNSGAHAPASFHELRGVCSKELPLVIIKAKTNVTEKGSGAAE